MSTMPTQSRFGGSALTIGICVVLAILGFFLLTEHQAPVFGLLPYLLLLACPVIHLLTHGRHGTHAHGKDAARTPRWIPMLGQPRGAVEPAHEGRS